MRKHTRFYLTLLVLSALLIFPAVSFCGDNTADFISIEKETVGNTVSTVPQLPKETLNSSSQTSLLDLIKKGGIVGYLIILLSVVSLALIVDYGFTIRKGTLLPSKDVLLLQKLIDNPSDQEMKKFEKTGKSLLAKVTIAGLKESSQGYQAMIKAMDDTGEALTSGIARKTEHLSVIGNISPMMGLLGTVIGMLRCFNEIAHMTGAIEPKQLAAGIFEALITTCMGLIVAIPALYFYAVFRNRVDEYAGEAVQTAEKLVAVFKKGNNGLA